MSAYDTQKISLLARNPDFQKSVIQLRKKWGLPKGGFGSASAFDQWTVDFLKSSKKDDFQTDFERLLARYDLSSHYTQKVHEHLFFNNLTNNPEIEAENVRFFWRKDKKNPSNEKLFFEIYGDTRLEDIKRIWPFVKRIQKSALGYTTERRKPSHPSVFERDLLIYDLSLTGLKHSEIARIVAEDPRRFRKVYSIDISKIIAQMKEKILGK